MRAAFHIIGALLVLAGPAPAQGGAKEERLVLPSGLEAVLQEVVQQGETWRFRFVAPAFDRAMTLEAISADLEHLCANVALPQLPDPASGEARIVVSLADKPSEFGVADPGVAQVFEAYRVEGGLCIWEVF